MPRLPGCQERRTTARSLHLRSAVSAILLLSPITVVLESSAPSWVPARLLFSLVSMDRCPVLPETPGEQLYLPGPDEAPYVFPGPVLGQFLEPCVPDARTLEKPGPNPWSLSILRTFDHAGVSGFLADEALLPMDMPGGATCPRGYFPIFTLVWFPEGYGPVPWCAGRREGDPFCNSVHLFPETPQQFQFLILHCHHPSFRVCFLATLASRYVERIIDEFGYYNLTSTVPGSGFETGVVPNFGNIDLLSADGLMQPPDGARKQGRGCSTTAFSAAIL